jgi:hypothetical protein
MVVTDNEAREKEGLAERENEALKRLLSTPPTPHKPKPESPGGVSPKKRGRPAKGSAAQK